jgi:aerotaxis receptor
VTSVQHAAVIMEDITAASRVQNDGIAEVNAALAQLDGITRENAGLVEESAAASASVATQAGHLAQALSVFKLAR